MDDQSRFASTLEDFGTLLDVDPKKLQDLLEKGSIRCEECKPNRAATPFGHREGPSGAPASADGASPAMIP